MSANQVEKEAMLAEWARDAKECKASGMTVKDWCASKGLNINTAWTMKKCLLKRGFFFYTETICLMLPNLHRKKLLKRKTISKDFGRHTKRWI